MMMSSRREDEEIMFPTIGIARDHHSAYVRSHRPVQRPIDRRTRRDERD
jgi:hypothetical protein